MLKLNVGGHKFTTSLETMTKDPCIVQSDICLMISIGLKSCDNTQTKDSIFIF